MGAVHVGRVSSVACRLPLHHAQLSPAEMEELVPGLFLHQYAVDFFLLLRHGLDDYHHR